MKVIDRETSKIKGLKHFFTGEKCGYGHLSPRFVSSGGCVECSKSRANRRRREIAEYQKQYREQTRKKRLKYHKEYYQANAEQIKQQNAKYRQHHEEYYSEYNKQYYDKNKRKLLEYAKEYRDKNRDNLLDKKKEYYNENKIDFIARNAKRRAAKLQATPSWFEKDKIQELYEAAHRRSQATGVPHHVDHIIPLVNDLVCGLHCLANLQVLTAAENGTKSNKLPQQ